jgi:hypothetical protein
MSDRNRIVSALHRAVAIVRESIRTARATTRLAPRHHFEFEVPSLSPTASSDSALRRNGRETPNQIELSKLKKGKNLASVDSSARALRATNAISAMGHAIEQASALRVASPSLDAATRSSLQRENLGASASFASSHLQADLRFASPIRGMAAVPNLAPRDLAEPSNEHRRRADADMRQAITINSSPTVVINAPVASSVRHDLIEALRAHREELFDQLKRESTRRERAQF